MSITGSEILEALQEHLNVGETSANTDPTQSLLISYINKAMRKIAYKLEPDELKSEAVDVATVANTNTATVPSTLLKVKDLFTKDAGDYRRLEPKPIAAAVNPIDVFDSNSIGTPSYYELRNSKIIVNKYFVSSSSDGLKAYGILKPTDLDIDDLSPAIDMSDEYEDAIIFQAAIYFYMKDSDSKSFSINRGLLAEEMMHLRTFVANPMPRSMTLDQRFFNHRRL